MSKYYKVQIIPEDSKEIKSYRINRKWFLLLKLFLIAAVVAAGFLIYNAGRIGRMMVNYENIRTANGQLVKQNSNYEELFMRIQQPYRQEQVRPHAFTKNRCRLWRWLETARRQGPLGTYSKRDSCCRNREQKIQWSKRPLGNWFFGTSRKPGICIG